MRILTTVLGVLIAFCTAPSVLAKEWRGIVPLRSVKADVERVLGLPSQSSPHATFYSLPDEIAVIHFQSVLCKDSCGSGWNVPLGTVTSIGVIPKGVRGRAKLDIGVNFKVEDGGAGVMYYTNDHDGVTLEKYEGRNTLIIYSPTVKDEAALQCPLTKDCIAHFFPKFDEYGNISFADEKARLDNYVNQMENMHGRGALVVVGQNRAVRKGLLKRAERAKRYLVQRRGFDAERLLIIDGGYETSSYTELHLYMIGGVVGRIYLFPKKDPGRVTPKKALKSTAR